MSRSAIQYKSVFNLPFLWVQSWRKFSAVFGTTSRRRRITIFPRGVSAYGAVFCLATTSIQTIGFFRFVFCWRRMGLRGRLFRCGLRGRLSRRGLRGRSRRGLRGRSRCGLRVRSCGGLRVRSPCGLRSLTECYLGVLKRPLPYRRSVRSFRSPWSFRSLRSLDRGCFESRLESRSPLLDRLRERAIFSKGDYIFDTSFLNALVFRSQFK